jgi:hypothetical protein
MIYDLLLHDEVDNIYADHDICEKCGQMLILDATGYLSTKQSFSIYCPNRFCGIEHTNKEVMLSVNS